MWRGWKIVLPIIVINAVVQGLLLLPGVLPYATIGFALTAVASFVALAASFTLVSASMLQAVAGAVSTHSALAALRARIWPILGWSLGLVAVVTMGLAFYVIPGLVAVVDRAPNPLATNFRVLGARWGRWLITIVVVALICGLVWLLSALDGFFVTGSGGAIIGWFGIGLVSSWLICAWALVYRSVVPRSVR